MSTATYWLHGQSSPREGQIDPLRSTLLPEAGVPLLEALAWQVPISGCVYGVALNYQGAVRRLAPQMHAAPYRAPPRAPVLYIKPRNTWTPHLGAVVMPPDVPAVEVGATLGLVMARDATRLRAASALEYVRGYTIVNDLTVPHASWFRPAIRQKCRDGFCPIGPWILDAAHLPDPDALELRVFINGVHQVTHSTGTLVRPVAALLADISQFMTLRAGDVLTVGMPDGAALARAGDRVAVEIDGIGRLENTLVAAPAARPWGPV